MNRKQATEIIIEYLSTTQKKVFFIDMWNDFIMPAIGDFAELHAELSSKRFRYKDDILAIFRKFLMHPQAVDAFLDRLEKPFYEGYRTLLHYGPMSMRQIADHYADQPMRAAFLEDVFVEHFLVAPFLGLVYTELSDDYGLVMEHLNYRDHQYYGIQQTVQAAWQTLIPKPDIQLDDHQGKTLNLGPPSLQTAEPHLLFDHIRGIKLKGGIKYKKDGIGVTRAACRAFKGMLDDHHQRFHRDVPDKLDMAYEEIALMTAGPLIDVYQDPLQFAKLLWRELEHTGSKDSPFQLEGLLPHLKINESAIFWSKNTFVEIPDLFAAFIAFFQQLEAGRIYTVRDLDARFRHLHPKGTPVEGEWEHLYCYLHGDPEQADDLDTYHFARKIVLMPYILSDTLVHPILKMICSLTAVWGMADLWLNEDHINPASIRTGKNLFLSAYDDVIAWRLNEMGAYVLGLSQRKPKTAVVALPETLYHLDPDHLVITRTGPATSVDLFLDHLADKIGENRYLVSVSSFRKGCNSVYEIQERQDTFRRELAVEHLPAHWRELFREALMRAEPLEKMSGYLVYQVNDHPQLRELFSSNAVLREVTLRAEQHKILVKPADLHKVLDVLRKNGFST